MGANRLHTPRMQAHFDDRLMAVAGRMNFTEWTEGHKCYHTFLRDAMRGVAPPPALSEIQENGGDMPHPHHQVCVAVDVA